MVIGVHQNEPGDLLAAFLEQTGITFPVIADRATLRSFEYPSGVGYPYPRDIVIDKNLTVRSIKASFNVAEMDELITQLLAEPGPGQ